MSDARIEILHVGSACRDLTTDDPRGWRLGGGVTYAALTTARLGLRTAAVVGADHLAAGASELDRLRLDGVALRIVPLAEGPVFRNDEAVGGRVQTIVLTGHPLPVVEIPASWVAARAWSIVPVAAEVTDDWATTVPAAAYMSVGWQGWLRTLVAGETVTRRAPSPSRLLARADLVGLSRNDLAPGTRPEELGQLLHPGASLVVTEGGAGGQLLRFGLGGRSQALRYTALETPGQVDPTGAGDTFLAALLASIVRPSMASIESDELVGPGEPHDWPALRAGLSFAAAAASLVVEAAGLTGVPDLATVVDRRASGREGRDKSVPT